MAITLGSFDFQQFEVPEKVRFGGRQSLAIHKLPGGSRVIDIMGRDDSEITWTGTFSGANAGNRSRQLDAMRVAGLELALTWDAFCYSVIISRLDLEFRSAWWIPFKITCVVVSDGSSSPLDALLLDLPASVFSDLASASIFYDVSTATLALSLAGSLSTGNQSIAAIGAIDVVTARLNNSIGLSESALVVASPSDLAQAAQSLAQLCCAKGFVSRAAANLSEATD